MTGSRRKQLIDIFLDRNFAILFGSPGRVLALTVQPLILGFIVCFPWKGEEAGARVLFIVALSAVYLGCLSSCTILVRERLAFDRERLVGVESFPYLTSKLLFLGLISLWQALLLQIVVSKNLLMHESLLSVVVRYLTLWLTIFCASALGLVVSAISRKIQTAMMLIPIILIPQIVFSETVLGSRATEGTLGLIANATLTKYAHDLLEIAEESWSWGTFFVSSLALVGLASLFAVISLTCVKARRVEL